MPNAAVAEAIASESLPPAHSPQETDAGSWWPRLSETGVKVFLDESPYILVHGERGSGKTMGLLHKITKHAYEYDDALVVIVTLIRSSATQGGAWEKLLRDILPEWKEGIGLQGDGPNGEFVERRDDSQNRYVWIGNQHGGWSKVLLRSMLHGEHIQARIKGMEFSMFFFDELTETDSPEYFEQPIQQMRRPGIPVRQFLGACNPSDEGEDHWVYQRFMVKENQNRPEKYAVYHLPMTENIFMDPQEKADYLDQLEETCRNNPAKRARLLEGKWVRQPRGDGLLSPYFNRALHVRGDKRRKRGLIPANWPILTVGYDLGTANSSISIMQTPPTADREMWGIFDEIVHFTHVPHKVLVFELLRKMNFWCKFTNTPYRFHHISDLAAFNQMNSDGTYDARQVEKYAKDELEAHPERYPYLRHLTGIKMMGCPKPAGSISARVSLTVSKLGNREILVSSGCQKHTDMFEFMRSDKKKSAMHPLKDASGHIHVFDSMTYPMYYLEMGGRKMRTSAERKSSYLAIGG